MYFKSCVIVVFVVASILIGCTSQAEQVNMSLVDTFGIEFADLEIASIDDHIDTTRFITLDEELSVALGWIQHFFVVDDNHLILVDESTNTLVKVDFSGKTIWRIDGREDDYRVFSEIWECEYDRYNKEVVVYDPTELDKEFRYDLDGKFVSSKSIDDFFLQQYFLSAEDVIYSMQGYTNESFEVPPQQLYWKQRGELVETFITQTPHFPRSTFIAGYSEFDALNGNVLYHAALKDTFYKIDLPQVTPELTLKFKNKRETAGDLMLNPNIKNKLKHARENYLPVITHLAADESKVALSYHLGAKYGCALMDRPSNSWLFNAQILQSNGQIFLAPDLYNDGYFLRAHFKYEQDFLNGMIGKNQAEPDFFEQMKQLGLSHGDTDLKVLCLVKI